MRPNLLHLTVCVAAGCAGFVGYRVLSAPTVTEARLRASIAPEPETPPANSPFSPSYHRDLARLINHMARRERWSEKDTDWLVGVIGSIPHEEDVFASAFFEDALVMISERIGWQVTTPDRVERAWDKTVQDLLHHKDPARRVQGVYAVSLGDRVSEHRARLDWMAAADPSERVRFAAATKLAQFDGLPTVAGDCPTCPKGGRP